MSLRQHFPACLLWLAAATAAGSPAAVESARAAACEDWSRSITMPRKQRTVTGTTCVLNGDIAYVAGTRLWVVDVAGSGEPAIIGTLTLPAAAQEIAQAGDLLYIACGDAGVVEVDVRDPWRSAVVRAYDPALSVVAVECVDGRVIARDSASTLHVLDTATPGALGALFTVEWPEPILAMCEAEGFLVISQAAKLGVLNVRNASSLTAAAWVEREAVEVAHLCSDGLRVLELSGHTEWTADGYGSYISARMASFHIAANGGIALGTATAPGTMTDGMIAAGGGIVVASSAVSLPAGLWSSSDLAFLGRLSVNGQAVAIDGERLIVAGTAGLAVVDHVSRRPLPTTQIVHGEPVRVMGTHDTNLQTLRMGPWLIWTELHSSYSMGYWGGWSYRMDYELALAEDPTRPETARTGEVSWYDANSSDTDPCAWGGVSFLGQAGDRAVVWTGTGCEITVLAASASRPQAVATLRIGPHYWESVGVRLFGHALWSTSYSEYSPLIVTLTRYDLDDQGFHQRAAFEVEGWFTLTGPDADLLIMVRADRFEAFDTSEPTQLVPVGALDHTVAPGTARMAWLGRKLIWVSGSELSVLDFSDPAAPRVCSRTTLAATTARIRLVGDRLVILYQTGGSGGLAQPQFQIATIDDVGTVQLAPPVVTSHPCGEVVLCGETAYADDGTFLHAYDLSDPAAARHIGMAPCGNGNLDCAGDYIGSGSVLVPRDCRDRKPPRPVHIEVRATLKPGDPSGYAGPAVVPVAVLGAAGFDPSTLEAASLRFGPLGAPAVPDPAKRPGRPAGETANEPPEAVYWFPVEASGMETSAGPLTLTGRTLSGEDVYGLAMAWPEPVATRRGTLAIEAAPNPFNPSTTLRFNLPESGPTKLTVRNLRGESVRTLIDEVRAAGDQAVVWDGLDDRGGRVASGVYLVSVEAGGTRATSRIALLK